jgi:hypothetical protein
MRKPAAVIVAVVVILAALGGLWIDGQRRFPDKASSERLGRSSDVARIAEEWVDPVTGENRQRLVTMSLNDAGGPVLTVWSEGSKEIMAKVAGLTPETAQRFMAAYTERLAFDPADSSVYVDGRRLEASASAHLQSLTGGPTAWAGRFGLPPDEPVPHGGAVPLATTAEPPPRRSNN